MKKMQHWEPMMQGVANHILVEHHEQENPPGSKVTAWVNRLYDAIRVERPNGTIHISFKRRDRAAVRDWRHMQQIKNELAGPEREGLELFPRESRLLDGANQYHIWVLPEGMDVPIGYDAGAPELFSREETVKINAQTGGKGRQRAWEKGLTTGLGTIA